MSKKIWREKIWDYRLIRLIAGWIFIIFIPLHIIFDIITGAYEGICDKFFLGYFNGTTIAIRMALYGYDFRLKLKEEEEEDKRNFRRRATKP